MARSPRHITTTLVVPLLALLALAPAPRAEELDNGIFRFLTQAVPVGSTNTEYIGQLIAVNADGPVTYGVDQLPPGMSLDPATGILGGRPESTFNKDVTFTADDGISSIQLVTKLSVNSSGGGGNDGSTVTNVTLLPGRMGEPFEETLSVENGVGPYIFGAVSLPPGLSLDGESGIVSGEPLAAGTFYVRFTVVDLGEDNKIVTVLPLRILPADSDFAFTTTVLNHGEVGTPFCDTWTTSGGQGKAKFGASGLPPGLAVDKQSGVVTGTPERAGTYEVLLTASDAKSSITTNLTMVIAPSAESSFYWSYFGIPTAITNLSYDRQPPIRVAAENGASVSYSAVGLPDGILYDPLSGELSGTANDIGEYTATFTATDAASDEVIELNVSFLVLPPTGGDANSLPVNLWVRRQKARTGTDGKDSWAGVAVYNANRTATHAFDPQTEALRLELGSRILEVEPGAFSGTSKMMVARSEKGVTPVELVRLSTRKQLLRWSSRKDDLADSTPGTLQHVTTIGDRGYRLDAYFDSKGTFKPFPDLRRAAFVVEKADLRQLGAGKDKTLLVFRLGDPSFLFDELSDNELRLRLLVAGEPILERDFTGLGVLKTAVHKGSGATIHKLKTIKDDATADRVKSCRYDSSSGRLLLRLEGSDLSGLSATEEHVSVELTVGAKTYYTSVTLFEGKPGRRTTLGP